jgi:hypothetical protein
VSESLESALRPGRPRAGKAVAKRAHCSFCGVELDATVELTIPGSGRRGQRGTVGSFCSVRCRDCVLALAALHPSPLATAEFVSRRTLVTDRLLHLWRQGEGPDPALVLLAAQSAGRGLASHPPAR